MTYTAVKTFSFAGSADTAIETSESSLSLTWGSSGYLVVNGSNKYGQKYSSPDPRVARDGGTYTNDQYIKGTISGMTGSTSNRLFMFILQASADTGSNSDFYALKIFNDASVTSQIDKYSNGTPTTVYGPVTSIAWANNDVVLFEILSGVLTAYRNGTATSATYTDGSALTGGKPAWGMLDSAGGGPVLLVGSAEMGDVTSSSGGKFLKGTPILGSRVLNSAILG